VKVEACVKDTRAGMVAHFKDVTWYFPGALFALTPEERANGSIRTRHWVGQRHDDAGPADEAEDASGPEAGDDADVNDPDAAESEPDPYPVAAE
jgi:hypothetical protein